jgi:WD40 repeat protein
MSIVLERSLESFVLPKSMQFAAGGVDRGKHPLAPVFRDEDEMVPGSDLPARIREGLENSEFLIVLCSPISALQSEWVNKEIMDFLKLGGAARILAVIVDGVPNAVKKGQPPEREALPLPLRRVVRDGIITEEFSEPLWVDWRAQGRHDRLNFLRLVAALLSLNSFDDLIRRDQAAERTRRRITQTIAAVIGILGILSAIGAYFAIERGDEALESQSRFLSQAAEQLLESDPQAALLLSLEALPSPHRALFPRPSLPIATKMAAAASMRLMLPKDLIIPAPVNNSVFTADGMHLVALNDKSVGTWDIASGHLVNPPVRVDEHVLGFSPSPDGRRYFTVGGDDDTVVHVRDSRTGKVSLELSGHEFAVVSAAFSPDGTRILTFSDADGEAGRVHLWDANTGHAISVLRRDEEITIADFSPDGTKIVVGTKDGAWLLDGKSGAPIKHLAGQALVVSAAFNPDQTMVALAAFDGTVRVWGANTGRTLSRENGHEDSVLSVAFSPDGTRLLSASADKTARLWDAKSGAMLATYRGHTDAVNTAAFDPSGTLIITASDDGTARLWDLRSGETRAVLRSRRGEKFAAASFSSDGTHVSTRGEGPNVRLWDVGPARILPAVHLGTTVTSIRFSHDGGRFVTASMDGTARLWDALSGAELLTVYAHHDPNYSAAFDSQETRILTASEDGFARVFDSKTGAPLVTLRGHEKLVGSALFSPDGTRIVTGSDDGTGRLWDARTGATIAVLPDGAVPIFGPDGKQILSRSNSVTFTPQRVTSLARLWDGRTGKPASVLQGHQDLITSMAFSPDGRWIVTGAGDKSARIWNSESGQQSAILLGHEGGVLSAAFSPDGKEVLTASEDHTARLWDARSGKPIAVLSGHEARVTAAIFSPDGSKILTSTEDKARLWDAKTHVMLVLFKGQSEDGAFSHVSFSPDGKHVLTVANGTMQMWDASRMAPETSGIELARQICARLPEEFRDFRAAPELHRIALSANLDPNAAGPCDRYGFGSWQFFEQEFANAEGWVAGKIGKMLPNPLAK